MLNSLTAGVTKILVYSMTYYTLLFLFLVCMFGVACNTIKLNGYFPGECAETRSYKISSKGESGILKPYDTIVCKTIHQQFYYQKNKDKKSKSAINDFCICSGKYSSADSLIDPISRFEVEGYRFGTGAYVYVGRYLYVSDIFIEEHLSGIAAGFYKMIPKRIKLNHEYQFGISRDFLYQYKFLGFEDVEVQGRLIAQCLKLVIMKTEQPNTLEHIWFKKGVGVVKREDAFANVELNVIY